MSIGDQKEITIPDYKPLHQCESKQFEHGAHFEYISLFKSLIDLMSSLDTSRQSRRLLSGRRLDSTVE